jgi:radical SAM superfamily enzyme YgiQ (UPF0313 family)
MSNTNKSTLTGGEGNATADARLCGLKRSDVMLINAPLKEELGTVGNYAVFPAIGVLSLGTRIKRDYPGVELLVADGGISRYAEIVAQMDAAKPRLVGLSMLTGTYEEGLRLAEHAKNAYGSTIVVGNDHVGFLPELILRNRPYVDYVVAAEFGEEAMSYLVGRELGLPQLYDFPNHGENAIYFRNGDGIEALRFPTKEMSATYRDEGDIPRIDLMLENFKTITENYNRIYGKWHDHWMIPFVINNARGCGMWKAPCMMCSIRDLRLREGEPELFWKTVEHYNEKYGVNFFFEVCDSFLSFPKYVKRLIETMPFDPRERGIEFEVYARANDIVNNSHAITWMKELNVTRANVGVESGDDTMLASINKRNSCKGLSPAEINYKALSMLTDAGITFHNSFVLGILGETRETMNHTLEFMQRVAIDFRSNLTTLEASSLIPMPNSQAWDYLLTRENPKFKIEGGVDASLARYGISLDDSIKQMLRDKYDNRDLLDSYELGKDWIKYFTHVTWDDIGIAVKKSKEIGKGTKATLGMELVF